MNYSIMWEELYRYVNANKDAYYNIKNNCSNSATDMSSLTYILSDQGFRLYTNIALKMIELEQQERKKYLKSAFGCFNHKYDNLFNESEGKADVDNN